MPDYLIYGQKAQIKLKLIAPKDYSISGNILLENGTASGFNNQYNLRLDAQTPELTVEYTPDLTSAEFGKADIKTKFIGNDSDNYSATTYSKPTPIYMRTLYAGPAQTIKSGSQEQLNAKVNQYLENQIGKLSNFSWQQLEGPTVQLTRITDRDVEFTAPEVSDVTKLRFSITASAEKHNSPFTEEKVVYVVPSDRWLKTVRTFQQDAIALREDGTAVAMTWRGSNYFVYQLPDNIEDISTIVADYSPSTIIVLHKNGTLKFITQHPYGGNQKTIKDELPKEPVTTENYTTKGIIFRANNIKEIVKAEGGGTFIKTFDNQKYYLDYSVYQSIEHTYSEANLIKATNTKPLIDFYDFNLSGDNELTGKFFNYPVNSSIITEFSLQNVALFSPIQPGLSERAFFAYLLTDNTPGFFSATRKAAIWGQEPDPSPLPIRNELIENSPFQSTPFVDVLPLGLHEEIYLLEANGNVSSYCNGTWENYPYFKNISEIGAMALRKDGTSILWVDPYPFGSATYLAKIRSGEYPNPANIIGRDTGVLTE